jgi:hypothetical protein
MIKSKNGPKRPVGGPISLFCFFADPAAKIRKWFSAAGHCPIFCLIIQSMHSKGSAACKIMSAGAYLFTACPVCADPNGIQTDKTSPGRSTKIDFLILTTKNRQKNRKQRFFEGAGAAASWCIYASCRMNIPAGSLRKSKAQRQ